MIARPRLRTSLLTVICALALALPMASCGGDDPNQFREDYNAAVSNLSKINSEIGSVSAGGAGQSNASIAKELDNIAGAADKARGDLAKLDPPEDAKKEFDTLLAALETGVDDLRSMAKAAKANNPEQAQAAAQALTKSGQEITAAENALQTAVDG
ncbi:MAG: hypothetical protein M3550_08245 [Actinomycetota bacterium]|nr:hypothetical protein [Actinomycetota bacterium]